MKRFSLLLLIGALSLPAAFAEDEYAKAMAQVKHNAAAQQQARANANAQRAYNANAVHQQALHQQQLSRSSRYSSGGVPSRIYQPNVNGVQQQRVYTGRVYRGGVVNGTPANNGGANNNGAAAVNNAAVANGAGGRRWNRNGNYRGGNNNVNWSAYHNWQRDRHDRGWYRSHYNRFAVFGGGYYYWDNGFWFPAYGYDPYFNTYSYDAPIYSYQDQDPGQVIANVQGALQQQGYYQGEVDGTYGPQTRSALLRFQGDNGLPQTGQIDEDTLGALGMQ